MGANDLPVASSTQIVRGFEKLGWKSRRGKRNHFVLTHPRKPNVHLTIPDHNEVDRFILHSHIKQAGLTVDQFNVAFQSIGKAAGQQTPPVFPPIKPVPGVAREVFSLGEGEAVLQWPTTLDLDGIEDLEAWLALVVKKLKRLKKVAPSSGAENN